MNDSAIQLQSYIFTVARYDFDVYQKRFFYRLVELLQSEVKDRKLDKSYQINHNLLGDYEVQMPYSAMLKGEEDKNHSKVVKSLKKLQQKIFTYEDDEIIELISLIYKVSVVKNKGVFICNVDNRIIQAILNFNKGFSKYDLAITFQFKSVYAMRLYELMYSQSKSVTYSIDYLREMFAIGTKYKETKDFIRYTIEPAKKEIDNSESTKGFTYALNTGKYNKIESITFTPTKTIEVEVKELMKTTSLRFDIDKHILKYLKENFGFQDVELKNNRELFREADKYIDIMNLLASINAKKDKLKNPKGYIINSLRKSITNKQKGEASN